jgi:hypothetical protein
MMIALSFFCSKRALPPPIYVLSKVTPTIRQSRVTRNATNRMHQDKNLNFGRIVSPTPKAKSQKKKLPIDNQAMLAAILYQLPLYPFGGKHPKHLKL